MIEFTKSYKTSDGQVFGSIEAAQEHEIFIALELKDNPTGGALAKAILDKKSVLVDILTTTPNSKPKARSIHGGKKVRKSVVTDATASVTSTNNT